MATQVALQSTAKDLIVTITNSLYQAPVLLTGAGVENWIEIDNVEDLDLRIGADGTTTVNGLPALVQGRMYLQPQSLGAAALRSIQDQKQLGLYFPSTLVMTSPSGQWTQTYTGFYLRSANKGFEATNTHIPDVVFEWRSNLPQVTVIGDYINLAANIVSAAAQLL